jgi:hypothetical protein
MIANRCERRKKFQKKRERTLATLSPKVSVKTTLKREGLSLILSM